jgi:hypothetical protein
MAAVANNPTFAKKAGIKPSVGEEFMKADKGKKFAKGGKIRRYDEGGGVREGRNANIDEDTRARALAWAARGGEKEKDTEGGMSSRSVLASTYDEPMEEPRHEVAAPAPAKKQSFGEAFRDARANGQSTFTWNGGTYGTEMAKPAARPAAAPQRAAESPVMRRQMESTGARGVGPMIDSIMSGGVGTPARRTEASESRRPSESHRGSGRSQGAGDEPKKRAQAGAAGAGRSASAGDYPKQRANNARYADQRQVKESWVKPRKADSSIDPSAFKRGGHVFAKGGNVKMKETMGPRGMGMDVEKGSNKLTSFGESAVQKRGRTKGMQPQMAKGPGPSGLKAFAKGGHVSSASGRADGIASKGKTKGRMVMCKGGKM